LRIGTGKVEAFHGNHSAKGDRHDGTLQQHHGQMLCMCEYGCTESGRSERELRKVPVNGRSFAIQDLNTYKRSFDS
jgi:hypothetical protein